MKFCPECGYKLNGEKFCPECGYQINGELSERKHKHSEMECPYCGSDNISTQIVTKTQGAGCFTVFVYLFLALTVVGIPIILIILLAKGKKTKENLCYVCQNCGRKINDNNIIKNNSSADISKLEFTKEQQNKIAKVVLTITAIIIIFGFAYMFNYENREKEFTEKKQKYTYVEFHNLISDYNKDTKNFNNTYNDKLISIMYSFYRIEDIVENKNYEDTFVIDSKTGEKIKLYLDFEDITYLKKFTSEGKLIDTFVYCSFDNIEKNKKIYSIHLDECWAYK